MIGAILSTLSGLIAFSTQMDVTVHNIAHANTDGFKKYRTEFVAVETGGVRSMIPKSETTGPTILSNRGYNPTQWELSNVDVGEETVNLIVAQRGFEANLQALKTADDLLGHVLDTKR